MKGGSEFLKGNPHCTFAVIKDIIVGATLDECTLHIWNYNKGVKIKTEVCPNLNNYCVVRYILATPFNDIILWLHKKAENFNTSHL